MKQLKILWQFSRSHTIIGSVCSITSLYIIACKETKLWQYAWLYAATLIAALACNIFIVGINQVADVELDKINKPYLPMAAGTLTKKNALQIVYVCLFTCLVVSFFVSYFLFALISLILLIGVAYSLPPLKLKQHHLPAALAITLVRGFLVNVGMFLHFQQFIHHNYLLPDYVWCITFFIMAFSIAIAWFKDLPDTEGDNRFAIKTFPLLYSKRNALWGGTILVSLAYVYVLYWSSVAPYPNTRFLLIAHSILFVLFLINFASVKLNDQLSIKKFYLRFWVFFFAAYLVFALWVLL
jgi:homogentisate phytyltransferase / homogentisate geranylgeranyltransferase